MEKFDDIFGDLSQYKILSFEEVSKRFEGNKNPFSEVSARKTLEEINYERKFGIQDKCKSTEGNFYSANLDLNNLLNDLSDRGNERYFFYYQNYALVNPTINTGISPSTLTSTNTTYTPPKYFDYTNGNEAKSAVISVELNHRACFISLKNAGSVFYLNPEKEEMKFQLEFVYTDYLDKRVFNARTGKYELDKKYNAVVVSTENITGFIALSEKLRINNDAKNEIITLFTEKVLNTKKPSALKFLYENMPDFVTEEILNKLEQNIGEPTVKIAKEKTEKVKIENPAQNFLWKHLELLSDHDDKGFFSWTKDSSGALINLLKIFKDSNFIFESFKNNQTMVKRIFSNMNNTSVIDGQEISNKTIFSNFINALCFHNAFDGLRILNKEFVIGNDYAFSSGSIFQEEKDNQFFLQQLKKVTRKETEIIPDDLPSQVERIQVEKTSLDPTENGDLYHPMDIVHIRLDGEKDFTFPLVAAICIKALAEEREQQELEKNIRIGLDIFIIVVGTATMLTTGNPAVFALAFADVALASADGVITANREEIAAMPGGTEFLEKWEKVYFIGGILLATPVTVKFLFARAANLYHAAVVIKNFKYVNFFKSCMIKIMLERKILTFAGNTLKSGSSIEIKILEYNSQAISKATAFAFGRYENLLPLYEKGAVLVEIEGKEYALIYKGEKLIQGTSADKYMLKFFQELKKTIKNPEKLKSLLETAYKEARIQQRVKEMAKWIDGNTKKPYGNHELETLAQMEVEQSVVLRPTKLGEAGDAIVEQGKQIGESWDAMGLTNNPKAIVTWQKYYEEQLQRFFNSIDGHFGKITPDPAKGIPALDKVIIDGKHFDLFNPNLKTEVIEHIKSKFPQYYETEHLELLNFKNK
ncbi:hypothetical protein [Chryseobacterium sp. GP-SGM7]|uniref:hypothetical protein n=1 Tax=Chryseobacterium sp. GP-SGM7 TaxID=3411323 RepID=UPI003B9651B4